MKKPTFIEYLTELMVSDDPVQALKDVKMASRNPSRYQKQQLATNAEDQKEIQTNKDDPLKSDKLRIAKQKQQLEIQQKRVAQKEQRLARQAGVEKPQQGPGQAPV